MQRKLPKRKVKVLERVEDSPVESPEAKYQVILYNDNVNFIDDVIKAVMSACKTSRGGAEIIVNKAHHNGKASCYIGSHTECEKVVSELNAWKLTTAIEKI